MPIAPNISSTTNAAPIEVTTVAPHGLATGAVVTISGLTVNTAGNGTWMITVTGASTFTLDGSTGNGSGADAGFWAQPGVHAITAASNASPIVITSTGHGLVTGNYVSIAGVGGNTNANSTTAIPAWGVTKVTADTFSIPVAGNSNYTSGGTWTSVVVSSGGGSTGSTIAKMSGPGTIVLDDGSLAGSIVDGDLLAFAITIGGLVVQTGLGTFTQSSNSISQFVSNNGMLNLLGDGSETISFTSLGPILPGEGAFGNQFSDTVTNYTINWFTVGGANPGEVGNYLRSMYGSPLPPAPPPGPGQPGFGGGGSSTSLMIGGLTVRQNNLLLRFLRGLGITAPPPQPAPAPPPGPGTRLGNGGMGITLGMAAIQVYQNQVLTSGGTAVCQGVLSVVARTQVIADGDRCGVGSVMFFCPGPSLPTGITPATALISLYYSGGPGPGTIVNGWSDFRILSGGVAMQCPLNQLTIPFSFDATKHVAQDTVRAGQPADIFSYVSSGDPAGTNQQPKMFFVNWQNANSRFTGTGGSQVGHRLITTGGVTCLRVVSEPWYTSVGAFNGDLSYLYLGTIIPIANGYAVCMPNLRLVTNFFTRIPYTDEIDDASSYWLVNNAFHNDDLDRAWEPMNPTAGAAMWSHAWIDPTDGSSVASAATLPGFSVTAEAVGPVMIGLYRKPLRQIITGASNATPIVITSVAHGLSDGDIITIAGVRVTPAAGQPETLAAANGTWQVLATTADTLTLRGSAGDGVYKEGGYFVPSVKGGVQMYGDQVTVQENTLWNISPPAIGLIIEPGGRSGNGPYIHLRSADPIRPGMNMVSVLQTFSNDGLPTSFNGKRFGFVGHNQTVNIDSNFQIVAAPTRDSVQRVAGSAGLTTNGQC